MDRTALLRAYDEHLRTRAEVRAAATFERLGPLWLARFGDEGFVTYGDLAGVNDIHALVGEALSHFSLDAGIREVEWKSRAHDAAPGLHGALLAHGFVPQEPESIMIGELRRLVEEAPPLPAEVTVRRVTDEAEVRAVSALQDLVFEGVVSEAHADELLRRLGTDPNMQLWAAEMEGEFVAAGRVELVPGTPFAGLWAGATREEWRRRGIYGALTGARAAAALEGGKTLGHSDSTENSRPILERSGMVKVSTTTPYIWRR